MAIVGISTQDIDQALTHLTPAQSKVFLAFMRHVNVDGRCWPSIARLAEVARVSRRTVYYTIKALKALGLLVIERTGGGRGISNIYRFVSRWVRKTVQTLNRGREGGGSPPDPSSEKEEVKTAALPSSMRLLHRFGWPELATKEEFLARFRAAYEEHIGALSQRMEEIVETRLILNDVPPAAVAEAVVAEAVFYSHPIFGYVLSILDSTIKRGWIRDHRPGKKGTLRFGDRGFKGFSPEVLWRAWRVAVVPG